MNRSRNRPKRNSKQTAARAAEVAATYGTTCWLCHKPIIGQVSPDHVIPVAHGGADDISNLRPAHLICNVRRGAKRAPLPLVTTTRW